MSSEGDFHGVYPPTYQEGDVDFRTGWECGVVWQQMRGRYWSVFAWVGELAMPQIEAMADELGYAVQTLRTDGLWRYIVARRDDPR